MPRELIRPQNCGECKHWWQPYGAAYGYCDNWAGHRLESGSVCHPNMGEKKEESEAQE